MKKDTITIIMGDFNAKVGRGRRGDLIGECQLFSVTFDTMLNRQNTYQEEKDEFA